MKRKISSEASEGMVSGSRLPEIQISPTRHVLYSCGLHLIPLRKVQIFHFPTLTSAVFCSLMGYFDVRVVYVTSLHINVWDAPRREWKINMKGRNKAMRTVADVVMAFVAVKEVGTTLALWLTMLKGQHKALIRPLSKSNGYRRRNTVPLPSSG